MFNTLFQFYRSKEWETLRQSICLERVVNGELLCEHCHKQIVKAYDAICHHKTSLTESNVNNYDISLNPENIAVVHHRCHNEIHNRFGAYTRHIYIVYGSYSLSDEHYLETIPSAFRIATNIFRSPNYEFNI